MSEQSNSAGVLEAPGPAPVMPVRKARVPGRVVECLPTALALAALAGVLLVGWRHNWAMPAFSALVGADRPEADDWCAEHSVRESACVECHPDLLPKGKEYGWCRRHGVPECPHCNPAAGHRTGSPSTDDRRRATEALAFAHRPENASRCRQHLRRIQVESDNIVRRLDIRAEPAALGPVTEAVTANGELDFDPTRVARPAARAGGTVRAILKQVGDPVRAGEVVAVVDAADVGRAKGEFQQAIVSLALKEQVLAGLRESVGKTVAGQAVQEAEAARAESEVRLVAAREALTNLGLPVRSEEYLPLAPAEAARRLMRLGLPADLEIGSESNNLLPVRAPFDGRVVERLANPDEVAGPDRPVLVVADPKSMWLTLHVRLEDAGRVRPGQPVRFRHDGHDSPDTGTVAWVSPTADERTRTVPVRAAWTNTSDPHPAKTFGTAQIILRHVTDAVVVPRDAVHWEGCCHVVFVRDRDFEASPYKVFHVRKVRPGASDALTGPVVEIAAGLLPGEEVATANSGLLRSELLKNDLGAG